MNFPVTVRGRVTSWTWLVVRIGRVFILISIPYRLCNCRLGYVSRSIRNFLFWRWIKFNQRYSADRYAWSKLKCWGLIASWIFAYLKRPPIDIDSFKLGRGLGLRCLSKTGVGCRKIPGRYNTTSDRRIICPRHKRPLSDRTPVCTGDGYNWIQPTLSDKRVTHELAQGRGAGERDRKRETDREREKQIKTETERIKLTKNTDLVTDRERVNNYYYYAFQITV